MIAAYYLVQVDGRLPVVLAQKVVVSHTDLTEVTGVEFVEVGAVVVLESHDFCELLSGLQNDRLLTYLTTSHTATTGVLPVLADTTITRRNVTAELPRLRESGRHGEFRLVRRRTTEGR